MRRAHATTLEPFSDLSLQASDALEVGKRNASRTTTELSSYLAFRFSSAALWTLARTSRL